MLSFKFVSALFIVVMIQSSAPSAEPQLAHMVFFTLADDTDEHSARPSPTRDELAFVSDRSQNADVYLVEMEGGVPRNLTRTPMFDEYAPHWSPDGELLVVTTVDVDADEPRLADRATLTHARLRVIDREGRVLLDTPGFMPDWMPPW